MERAIWQTGNRNDAEKRQEESGERTINKKEGKGDTMNIEKTENGNEITLMPVGRLDTTTAPQLEAQINADIDGAEKLILDFQGLEYLSSAGLRVLLGAHKAFMKRGSGELVICHVNETIHEVFELTGFLDILNIE